MGRDATDLPEDRTAERRSPVVKGNCAVLEVGGELMGLEAESAQVGLASPARGWEAEEPVNEICVPGVEVRACCTGVWFGGGRRRAALLKGIALVGGLAQLPRQEQAKACRGWQASRTACLRSFPQPQTEHRCCSCCWF